jgi:uncharacterized membrane protein YuzA (DUF378 family)
MSTKLSKNEKRFYVAAVIIASIGAINWGLSIMGVNLLSVIPNRTARMAIYGIIGIAGVFAFCSALRWASKKDSEEEKQRGEYYRIGIIPSNCFTRILKPIQNYLDLISQFQKELNRTHNNQEFRNASDVNYDRVSTDLFNNFYYYGNNDALKELLKKNEPLKILQYLSEILSYEWKYLAYKRQSEKWDDQLDAYVFEKKYLIDEQSDVNKPILSSDLKGAMKALDLIKYLVDDKTISATSKPVLSLDKWLTTPKLKDMFKKLITDYIKIRQYVNMKPALCK